MEHKFEATLISKVSKKVKEVKILYVRNYRTVSAVKSQLGLDERHTIVQYMPDGFKLFKHSAPEYWEVRELVPDSLSKPRNDKFFF